MEINSLAAINSEHDGSDTLSINQAVKLDSPFELSGRRVYRRIYYLRFVIDPSCDGIVINHDTSKLEGCFQDYILQLQANDTTFQSQSWQAAGSTDELVKVHLTHPWQLYSVSTTDFRGVEVFRLDGEAVSVEPTITGNSNRPFTGEFGGQDFALKKVAPDSSIAVQSQELREDQYSIPHYSELNVTMGATTTAPAKDYAESGTIVTATQYGIRSINLKSMVTGPRILLGQLAQAEDPGNADGTINIWQQPGQSASDTVHFFEDNASWENGLNQLQKRLDDYFDNRKHNGIDTDSCLYLPIIFECDTPSILKLSQLSLQYSLSRKTFSTHSNGNTAGLNEKTILRFNGDKLETKHLELNLPPQCEIIAAHLKVNSQINNSAGFSTLSSLPGIDTFYSGVKVGEAETAAKQITVTEPQQVGSVLLATLPLTDEFCCTVKIIEAVNMNINGALRAEGNVQIQLKTQKSTHAEINRQWLAIHFDTPCLLDVGNYWLQLTSQQGTMLWLGEAGSGDVRFLSPGKIERKMSSLTLQSHFGYKADSEQKSTDIKIQIADVLAHLLGEDKSLLHFDLTDALNAYCQHSSQQTVDINFIADGSGNVTVKGLNVLYNI